MSRLRKGLPPDLQKTGGLVVLDGQFAFILSCEDGEPGTRQLVLRTGRDGVGQVTITGIRYKNVMLFESYFK